MHARSYLAPLLLCTALLAHAVDAEGQIPDRLRRAAESAIESEVQNQIARLIREAIRCAIDDPACFREAEEGGDEVIFTDDSGEIIVDDEGVPVTDRDQALRTVTSATIIPGSWRLDADGESLQGRIGYVTRGDGRLAIQLVNRDAVNLLLVMPDDGAAERYVETAFFAVGRGPLCALVDSEPRLRVRFEEGDGSFLVGRLHGTLDCPDSSELPVSGSFRVETPGE